MKNKIIADLGSNYRVEDSNVLDDLIEDITNQALFISNRKTIQKIEYEVKEAIKTIYLRRGTEDVVSSSESGRSSVYQDALEKLRTDLIANGKRLICK